MSGKEAWRERVREASRIVRSRNAIAIIALLGSPEPAVRSLAATAIRRQKITEALVELRRRLDDEADAGVRSSMALTLAELPADESRATLRGLLDDPVEDNRRMALRGLSRIGDESVIASAVTEYQNASGWHGKQEALDALSRLPAGTAELARLRGQERSWWWRRRIRRTLRRSPFAAR